MGTAVADGKGVGEDTMAVIALVGVCVVEGSRVTAPKIRKATIMSVNNNNSKPLSI